MDEYKNKHPDKVRCAQPRVVRLGDSSGYTDRWDLLTA